MGDKRLGEVDSCGGGASFCLDAVEVFEGFFELFDFDIFVSFDKIPLP